MDETDQTTVSPVDQDDILDESAGGVLGIVDHGRKKHGKIFSRDVIFSFWVVGHIISLYKEHRKGFNTAAVSFGLIFFIGLFYFISFLTGDRLEIIDNDSYFAVSHGAAIVSLAAGGFIFLSLFKMVERKRNAWQFCYMFASIALVANLLWMTWYSMVLVIVNIYALKMLRDNRGVFILRARYMLDPSTLMPLTLVTLTIAYGVIGAKSLGDRFDPSIDTWTDALYFTLVTVTTVGYGDFGPMTGVGNNDVQWFVITLIMLGVVSFLSSIVGVLGPFIENKLKRVLNLLEKVSKELLNNHVIICGNSDSVTPMTDILVANGINFLVISQNNDQINDMRERGVRAMYGDPASEDDLNEMGIDKAATLIACDVDESKNAFVALTAKHLNPNLKVISMVHTRENVEKFHLLKVDVVVSPSMLGSLNIFKLLAKHPGRVLLAGSSEISLSLMDRLIDDDRPFTLVTKEEALIAKMAEKELDVDKFRFVLGDPKAAESLRQGSIGTIGSLVVAGRTDAENAFICLTATHERPELFTIAVAHSSENNKKLSMVKGVNKVISPAEVGGRIMGHAAMGHNVQGT